MASDPSEVGICNSALIKIGAERISALTENVKNAILCNEQYVKLRDELQYSHPWKFTIKRAELGLLSEEPLFDYDYQFQLPTDCLRVLRVDNTDVEYKIEGRYLLCDETAISIKYISQVTDVSQFNPRFREALSLRLAADLAYAIAQNAQLAKSLMDAFMAYMRETRSLDAQEGTADIVEAETWLNSRF